MPRPRPSDTSPSRTNGISPCDLHQIYPSPETDTASDIDIIAIHGLDTKSPDTWRYKTKTSHVDWLTHERMLPTRVGNARIFTCNWPADLFQKSVPTTLKESAESLRDSIRQHIEQNNRTGKNPPILFIASCLGGIILLKALDMDRSPGNDNSRPSIISATRGIVFLATPFLGTAFKDMPDWELRAWASLNDKEVTALIDYTRSPTALGDLVHTFISLAKAENYHVWAFWEAGETNLLGKLYLGWVFSKRIHYAWPMVSILTLLLHAFSPWVLVLWLFWILSFPVFKSKQLVDEDSARARYFESSRLDRPHVLMNKFNYDEWDKRGQNDYAKVAIKIEEILSKIREGQIVDKADIYICEEHYTADRLKIERLSGKTLPMPQCYINLTVIRDPVHFAAHSEQASENWDKQASPFSVTTRLNIETATNHTEVDLAKIFDTPAESTTAPPRRILIRGRAGVGKTTLCKKMVYDFMYRGTWRAIFDRILWVPLRILKTKPDKGYNLEGLFLRHFFSDTPKRKAFAAELEKVLANTCYARTLFILDGLNEVSEGFDSKNEMHSFLVSLLNRPNVIVTCRPLAKFPAGLFFNLELETIGFYPDQVQEYIESRSPEQAKEIQSFLDKFPFIQGLVRIPIQLDALCFVWADGPDRFQLTTMTAVYEAITKSLWRKESERLDKRQNAMIAEVVQIENDHQPIVAFLECLAFNGMQSDVVEFQENHRSNAMRTHPEVNRWLGSFSFGDVSFLRTSDPPERDATRSYHFLHLTYQEFFAAQYFARQWQDGGDVEFFTEFGAAKSKLTKVSANNFLQENKYNSRYDIVWRFTVGLLEPDKVQSFFEAIERHALDPLGPSHQWLISHCLPEADKWNGELRVSLELRAYRWLLNFM
ncbi:hypothetical protein GGS24DRAFT_497899 [Hypoxylon argillaceum]|nr:hypothetical protein GGS24DRAFT_497899 [Hypoxylon argillaceum]